MLPLLAIGVMLFILQWFVPYGRMLIGDNDYTGYLRLAMLLAGAYCIFLAWPRWRDSRISDEEEEEIEALRERLWRRKFKE